MIFRSVTTGILLLVSVAFLLVAVSVLLFAGNRVNRILDTHQKEVYTEKIEVILGLLERTNDRLESTGLVEAYRDEFKKTAVSLLRDAYYKDGQNEIYPIIVDEHGKIIMDRHLPAGMVYQPQLNRQELLQQDLDHLNYITLILGNRWFILKDFSPWSWQVLYSIPLEVKYREAKRLIMTLSFIMFGITVAVLLLLSFLLTRLLNPVKELTELTAEISQGNFDRPVSVSRRDEFGSLANSFESMRLAINRQVRELEGKEENLRITLDSIGDGVIATDTQGKITRVNHVACSLTGWEEEEALGKEVEQVFHLVSSLDRKTLTLPVKEVLRAGHPSLLEVGAVLLSRGGKEYTIANSAAPIRSPGGDFYGAVMVFRDITQERAMQEQLQHDRRMEAVGQLAGGVAHDFNNMLAGIAGATELLELSLRDAPKAKKYVEMIRGATERAAELTHKLLAFSRKGKHVSTPVNIHAIIDEVIAILERSIDKRIELRKDLLAERAMISGDPSQLQSGILNLCINARDAMPDGGEILISTLNTDFDEEYCSVDRSLSPGTYIQISVYDTGKGIPPEIQGRIFEPFFTTKEVGKGTGLGLSAVYGMAKDHHGNVRFYSEPEKGTVFHLYLPVSEEVASYGGQVDAGAVQGSGTVLVVDDEKIIRTTASLLLENLGYTVLLAENGKEGVELYHKRMESIDLVILDMVMPVMDGREAFKHIIDANPDAKVIISSGFARDLHTAGLPDIGPAEFIMKPFSRVKLSKLIAKVLAEKQG